MGLVMARRLRNKIATGPLMVWRDETKVTDGEHIAYGRGPTREASEMGLQVHHLDNNNRMLPSFFSTIARSPTAHGLDTAGLCPAWGLKGVNRDLNNDQRRRLEKGVGRS
jgi:hypothetical protein